MGIKFALPEIPIAEATPWLVDTIVNPKKRKSDPPAAGTAIVANPLDGFSAGERDVQVFKYACKLIAMGLSPAEQQTLVLAVAARCKPPFPERDALRKLESARKTVGEKGAPVKIELTSYKSIVETELPTAQQIVQGLIVVGLTILASKPKLGKSWLVLNFLLAIARERLALGHFHTTRGAVLSLCLEDNKRRMKQRLGLILQDETPPENALLATEWLPFSQGGVDHLHKTLVERPEIKVVSIDTWQKFRGRKARGEDAYSGDYADLAELHSLATTRNVAIILVHHSRKEGADDWTDSILGSTALAGAADTLMVLKRDNRSSADAILHVTGRDLEDAEVALSFDSGRWIYKGDPVELRLTNERREIVEALAGESLTISEAATLLGKRYDAVKKLIYRLSDEGVIEKTIRGRYQVRAGQGGTRDLM